MQVKAQLKHLRISPRKVRLVCDLVKGLPISEALIQLEFLNKAAASYIKKLLTSAVANAVNNKKINQDELFIKNITVNSGYTLKRWKPRAMGRATMIQKKSSHVLIVLETKKKAEEKKIKKLDKEKVKSAHVHSEQDKKNK